MNCLLELKRAALFYLDKNGLLQNIRDKCLEYKQSKDTVYQFVITVEPCDLLELDPHLGHLLLNEPFAASRIFQEVIFVIIQTLDLVPRCKNVTQVIINIRLASLPPIQEFKLKTVRDRIRFTRNRKFLQYEGIIYGMSTVHKYTKVARFICRNKNCEGAQGERYIRVHIPGAKEDQTIRRDFICTLCANLLEEDVAYRIISDKVTLYLVDETAFTTGTMSIRHQSIVTHVRDDLVTGLEIGQKLCVIGTPVIDNNQEILSLEVNSLVKDRTGQPVSRPHLPRSIENILQDRIGSPWSFSLSLAYGFAGNIAPHGTYLHLKLGLLLSLVSDVYKENTRLDLLAVGSDTLVINRLLSYSASLSPRHIIHTSSYPLIASVCKEAYGSDIGVMTGGSLLLANGGVCVVPYLNSCKRQIKYYLLQALENNKILIEIPQRLTHHGAPEQNFLPRRCGVWATFDSTSLQKQKLDDVQVDLNNKDITQALANVFGIIYFVETPVESYANQLSTDQILMQAMGIKPSCLIPESDYKQFLELARQRRPSFSEASENLIKGYYVASRTVRADSVDMWTPPINTVRVVTALSEAHAKLCLRDVVTEHDAVIAILLYEEYVTIRSGQSVLGIRPLPHVKDNNMELYIGLERDVQLLQFEKHLKNFIHNYAPDVEIDITTEE